ncbi:MAG TPA: deoxyribodipyrimidine photo-lyase, partial [Kaistia sp.]|nr:deoxyribodipyrimidine photo-lyase [Kaistia sp.]
MADNLKPTLVWLRDDLRLADNPALTAGAKIAAPLVVLYILDEMSEGIRPLGGASKWWLHGSLDALGKALAEQGQTLVLRHGPAQEVLLGLAAE